MLNLVQTNWIAPNEDLRQEEFSEYLSPYEYVIP
jgi:hypothetical protein